jgi:hypothetical protein
MTRGSLSIIAVIQSGWRRVMSISTDQAENGDGRVLGFNPLVG